MSKTDKTDPYWVKLHRYGIEDHDHRYGDCDYDPNHSLHDDTRTWRSRDYHYPDCSKIMPYRSYGYGDKWFPHPKALGGERTRQNRVARRTVKAQLHHGDYDGIATYGTGRSRALWEMY